MTVAHGDFPQDIADEAQELARGAEILPEGWTGLAKKLLAARNAGRKLRVKLGVDPTSTDLHLGHAVVFRKLRRFQEFGHQVILIIGGFTAQIGDPSGRNATRPPLTREQVEENAKTYLAQMGLVLDMEKTIVRNNAEWLAPLSLDDILKLASKVTINQLLAKEAFGDRLDKQLPVSFHELFYPLLQGYDSVAIESDVELGGTDQRFNILQGRELQPYYGQDAQIACLLPLLEGTDGVKKMSKSYDNYISLKEEPNDMFGKVMRIPDELLIKYYELASTLTGEEIDRIKEKLAAGDNPMGAKLDLAGHIVSLYCGDSGASGAREYWDKVHSRGEAPDEIPDFAFPGKLPVFRILVDAGLAESASMAKRLVKEGGVRLDGEKLSDPNHEIESSDCDGKVLQVGKRKFARLKHS
ncbi:MAG: tyrosine--tRNA ligase [Cyanobacteria bacterium]|nr:tyrosine--tRNA ligase [Cyanobacteriota bacterium]